MAQHPPFSHEYANHILEKMPGLIMVRHWPGGGGAHWTLEMRYKRGRKDLMYLSRIERGVLTDSELVQEIHSEVKRWYKLVSREGIWASELHGVKHEAN